MDRLGRIITVIRQTGALALGRYAANGAYFLVLAVIPGLELAAMVPVLEEPVRRGLGMLGLRAAATPVGAPVLGIVAVWSASRGLYGVVLGLQAVYGAEDPGRWLPRRLVCMGYALGALAVGVVLIPLARWILPGGLVTAYVLQTAAFMLLYMAVSGCVKGWLGALAGSAAASAGCLGLTRGLGWAAERFSPGALRSGAGGLVLAYLWVWVLLLGAVLHRQLEQRT